MADRQAANALAARARRDELAERWDLAYAGYVEAAQKFLHLARAADAGAARPELREAARVLVVRAEQISKQRKTAIRPVLRDALAPGVSRAPICCTALSQGQRSRTACCTSRLRSTTSSARAGQPPMRTLERQLHLPRQSSPELAGCARARHCQERSCSTAAVASRSRT